MKRIDAVLGIGIVNVSMMVGYLGEFSLMKAYFALLGILVGAVYLFKSVDNKPNF